MACGVEDGRGWCIWEGDGRREAGRKEAPISVPILSGGKLQVTRRGAAVDASLTTLSPTSTMVGALPWLLASLFLAGVRASVLTLQSPRLTVIGADATPLRNEPCVSFHLNAHICVINHHRRIAQAFSSRKGSRSRRTRSG